MIYIIVTDDPFCTYIKENELWEDTLKEYKHHHVNIDDEKEGFSSTMIEDLINELTMRNDDFIFLSDMLNNEVGLSIHDILHKITKRQEDETKKIKALLKNESDKNKLNIKNEIIKLLTKTNDDYNLLFETVLSSTSFYQKLIPYHKKIIIEHKNKLADIIEIKNALLEPSEVYISSYFSINPTTFLKLLFYNVWCMYTLGIITRSFRLN